LSCKQSSRSNLILFYASSKFTETISMSSSCYYSIELEKMGKKLFEHILEIERNEYIESETNIEFSY
jgi:hypothetical protein